MTAQFIEGMTTKLRNIGDGSAVLDGLDELEFTSLLEAQDLKQDVTVLCEATDGYYDVQLQNGTKVDALSWYHLEGFDKEGFKGV